MLGEVFAKVDALGIADNTLVVLMADNGLMHLIPSYTSGLNELVYRGGKTDFLEGGIRVDAFVRWPAAIEGGTYAGDIIHVSDLYTTFARVAQATEHVPTDRVIDGIDQTALFLMGEHHGRRDYVYVYQNEILAAVVKQEFKMHMPAPGVPGAAAPVFNVLRDPREDQPYVGLPLWSGAAFQDMVKRHLMMIAQYPHAKLGKGRPYEGIENLRPETVETVETFMSWQPQ
jgi:arylsulfatase